MEKNDYSRERQGNTIWTPEGFAGVFAYERAAICETFKQDGYEEVEAVLLPEPVTRHGIRFQFYAMSRLDSEDWHSMIVAAGQYQIADFDAPVVDQLGGGNRNAGVLRIMQEFVSLNQVNIISGSYLQLPTMQARETYDI